MQALCLLPLQEIPEAVSEIEAELAIPNLSEDDPIRKFMDYVKSTWTDESATHPPRMVTCVSACKSIVTSSASAVESL